MEGGRDHPWMALCMEDKPINYGQKKGMKKSNDDVNNVTTKQMNATATEKLKRKKKNIYNNDNQQSFLHARQNS